MTTTATAPPDPNPKKRRTRRPPDALLVDDTAAAISRMSPDQLGKLAEALNKASPDTTEYLRSKLTQRVGTWVTGMMTSASNVRSAP